MNTVQQSGGGVSSGTGNFTSASLYVGDLSPDVNEALLFEIFNAVGPVASIRVCRDAITRRSLGYGYVNYHNVVDAERALDTMNFTNIAGRPCRIMWSQRDPALRKSGVGNIFVKNLDQGIDHKALFDTFSMFGNILSCKVAMSPTGESLGYGFVHYETEESALKAIEKVDGMVISGANVQVARWKPRSERSGDTGKFTNIYVKGLPESINSEGLRAMFEAYGVVTSFLLSIDSDGKSRGFGFVNFENPEDAEVAVANLNGKEIDGASLIVTKAQKKADRAKELAVKFEQMKLERHKQFAGANLYIKNLSDEVDDERLRSEFSVYGPITSARVMRDENARSKGFGFVCFTNADEATKAVTEMNGKIVDGKPLYVALAQRKEVRRAHLDAQYRVKMGQALPMGGAPAGMYPAGGPVFYPGQIPQRPGFVYPPQMMARRGGWPPASGVLQRGPAGPPLGPAPPVMYGNAMPRQQMPAPQGGRRPHRGGGGGANQRAGPQQNRPGLKYGVPQAQQQLTVQMLASAPVETQKQMIGERLFPLIQTQQPQLAGKITGMLLEMDNGELLNLLESHEALTAKIEEAMQVLDAHHSRQQRQTAEANAAAPADSAAEEPLTA
jgi:polyadenylate-binding protein